MNNLYLLQYKNYYNRTVEKPQSIAYYIGFKCQPVAVDDVNPLQLDFVPGDGIYTDVVINWNGENPDYVLVAEGNSSIISRWYVIESVRTRGGQFHLRLFRDLFADYYEQIMLAPAFIEKGYVPTTDSAIFNAENMVFNQIKQNEIILKDKTQTAWIVGYCAPAENPDEEIIVNFGGEPQFDYEINSLSDWEYKDLVNTYTPINDMKSLTYLITPSVIGLTPYAFTSARVKFNSTGNLSVEIVEDTQFRGIVVNEDDFQYLNRYKATAELDSITKAEIGYGFTYDIEKIKELGRDKIIKIGSEYYNIVVEISQRTAEHLISNENSNIYKGVMSLISNGISVNNSTITPITGSPALDAIYIGYENYNVRIELKSFSFTSGNEFTLDPDRPVLLDAPYCMFCIPYGDDYAYTIQGALQKVDKLTSLSLACGIATALGGSAANGASKLYDLQLLPYCPIPLVREAGNRPEFMVGNSILNVRHQLEPELGIVLYWATESTGSFDIKYNAYTSETDPIKFKIDSLTKFQRLCSPNYNGIFEFSVEKNGGVSVINVDYTYKPHQPYIHLNPNFGRLYGKDFNDARGLILNGDFSLPIMDNAWIDYEISNKNYQNIFSRQIQNMETTNEISRTKETAQMIAGGVSGGATGAMAGFAVGGPIGAIAGMVAGAGTSITGGIMDKYYNEELREETINYTKDLFGYNLQNIQALPNTLTKISSLNENNKIFPFIEKYAATPEEEAALKNKIIYNGMSIGRIGTLQEFYINKPSTIKDYGYFKGQFIRLENIGDDSHVANAIAQEFNKGWYIV